MVESWANGDDGRTFLGLKGTVTCGTLGSVRYMFCFVVCLKLVLHIFILDRKPPGIGTPLIILGPLSESSWFLDTTLVFS